MFMELREANKKKYTSFAYNDLLFTDVSSMFEWKLPDDCPLDIRFIEAYLLTQGDCAVWEVDGKLAVTRCERAGSLNVNGQGRDLICITGNGFSKTFYDFEKREDVVYIRNNRFATPDLNIERTADILTELYTSLRHNIINARYTPIVITRDAVAKTAIEKALKENNAGGLQVVLSDNIFDAEKENVLNVTDPNCQTLIQYINHAYDDTLRQFYNIYGLEVSGASKQAQQTEAEILSGANTKLVLPLDRMRERKLGAELISKYFGVECSVDFSEAWKRENEKTACDVAQTEEQNEKDEEVAENENV